MPRSINGLGLVKHMGDSRSIRPDSVAIDEGLGDIDLDALDPSVMPATGTPEPGGGSWWPTMNLLRNLFSIADVVAADVGEKLADPLAMYSMDVFTVTTNLAGLPALSLP